MNRTQYIQHYIDKIKATSYLEIGLGDGRNFDAIRCKYKCGVDPITAPIYDMTSDKYFVKLAYHRPDTRFDIIFIDGLHEYTQVLRDIENAMKYLSPNGLILLHDTNPASEHAARPCSELERYPPDGEVWNGDVWKAVCVLYIFCMGYWTHPEDHGITVIPKQNVKPFSNSNLLYKYEVFENDRAEILHITNAGIYAYEEMMK